MAQMTWEKSTDKRKNDELFKKGWFERAKFTIGGLLILGAVVYLMFSSTISGARFFITVEEILTDPTYANQTVRITGAVIGETIEYDSQEGIITFTVAHIPSEFDDLADALHEAVNNTTPETQLRIFVEDSAMPDLLQHEAQAIMTGELRDDGIFYASELLLKCPSRFNEMAPDGIAGHGA